MPITPVDVKTLKAVDRFTALASEQKAFTDRAEKAAKYTIPMAFKKETDTYSTNYDVPYQSIGARGVNNLASKLLLALFPPNNPFFRLGLGADLKKQMLGDGKQETVQQWETALSKLEANIMQYMESELHLRQTASEVLIQLIIAGNCLVFLPPKEGGMRMYRLNSYVLNRDPMGNVMEIVIKESIDAGALSQDLLSGLKTAYKPTDKVDVYTYVYRQDANYLSFQEIEGEKVGGSDQTYPIDKSPYIPLRFRKMDGESYGRSFVDEYLGDLVSLENLSKAMVDAAAISANILYFVNPNSTTRISDLKNAQSGDFIQGKLEDVQVLQMNKSVDLQVANGMIQDIQSRLSFAFLLNSAVQRNADRVTAEEIRYVANELQDTIGSIYAIMGSEFQLPLVRRVVNQMMRLGLMDDMPTGAKGIDPTITTGVEALGRGHDLTQLDQFLKYAQVFPEAFNSAVKQNAILTLVASALNIDPEAVIKTDQEIQQEQQQAMAAQAMQQGAGTAIANAAGAPAQGGGQ